MATFRTPSAEASSSLNTCAASTAEAAGESPKFDGEEREDQNVGGFFQDLLHPETAQVFGGTHHMQLEELEILLALIEVRRGTAESKLRRRQ